MKTSAGICLVAAVAAAGCGARGGVRTWTFEGPIDRVEVSLEAGGLVVLPGEMGRAGVTQFRTWWEGGPPYLTAFLEDGVLAVHGSCAGTCDVDTWLVVPPDVSLRADLAGGDVWIEGLGGGVEVVTARGTMDFYDVHGNVTAVTGEGDIGGAVLSSPAFHVMTMAGGVEGAFVGGALDLWVTATEDVDLAVPVAAYDCDASSRDGEVWLIVQQSPDAARRLYARTVLGDVYVHYAILPFGD